MAYFRKKLNATILNTIAIDRVIFAHWITEGRMLMTTLGPRSLLLAFWKATGKNFLG